MELRFNNADTYSTEKKSNRLNFHFIQSDDDVSDDIHVLVVEHEVESLCVPIGFHHRRAQVMELKSSYEVQYVTMQYGMVSSSVMS
jgi:hypothetical protein